MKRDYEDIQSIYSWSESPEAEHSKGSHALVYELIIENIYEKQPRRKMVQDPVTGTINANPKKIKSKKKATKASHPNMFIDLRPLDQFESKLIGKNRLSVSLFSAWVDVSLIRMVGKYGVEVCLFLLLTCQVKDLEFPRLSELGTKKTVGDQGRKRTQDLEEQVRGAKRQRKIEDDQPQISDYFEQAPKHDTNPVQVDDMTKEIAVHGEGVLATENEVAVNDNGTRAGDNCIPIPVVNMVAEPQSNSITQIVPTSNSGQINENQQTVEKLQNNEKLFEQRPSQPSYSPPTTTTPNIDLPGHHELTTDTNPPSAPVPPAPDPYPAILEQYTHLNSIIEPPDSKSEPKALTPKNPKPPDLNALIDTCTAILARNAGNPVRVCTPLRPQSVQFTNPYCDNTQEVADHFAQSPGEILKDYWMYPTNDGGEVRYVSGPPFKKRSVWSKWEDRNEAMLMTTQYNASPDQYKVVLNHKPGYGILPTATMVEVPEGTVLISTGRPNRYESGLGVFSTTMPRLNSTQPPHEVPRPLLLQHSVLATAPGIEDNMDRVRAEIAAMEREVEEEAELASNEDLDDTEIEYDDDLLGNHGTRGEEDDGEEDDQGSVPVPRDWWKNRPRRF